MDTQWTVGSVLVPYTGSVQWRYRGSKGGGVSDRVITGLLFCISLPYRPAPSHFSPMHCQIHISHNHAESPCQQHCVNPTALSCSCLPPHWAPLPLLWIPRGVRSKDIFPPIPVYILCHSVAWYIFTSGLMYTDKVQAAFILIHSIHFMVADDLFYNTRFVNRGDRVWFCRSDLDIHYRFCLTFGTCMTNDLTAGSKSRIANSHWKSCYLIDI